MSVSLLETNANYTVIYGCVHYEGPGRQCNIVQTHFHFILKLSPEEAARAQKLKNNKLIYKNISMYPIVELEHWNTLCQTYFTGYEPIEYNSNQTEITYPLTTTELALQHLFPKRQKKARILTEQEQYEKDKERYSTLHHKYKCGIRDQLLQYGMSPTLANQIKNEYEEYKQFKRAHHRVEKYKPMTQDEKQFLDLKAKEQRHKLLHMQNLINDKIIDEKKVPIVFLFGQPSSGKSYYAQILGEAYGTPIQLKGMQLYQDALMGEMIKRENADVMVFEELSLQGLNLEKLSKLQATLKDLTSGAEKTIRTAYTGDRSKDNYNYKIKLILISTNMGNDEIDILQDPGLLNRIVKINFTCEIGMEDRWTQEECAKYKMALVKFCMEQIEWQYNEKMIEEDTLADF